MEAEIHNLPSASWRTRKDSAVIQSEQKPKSQGAIDVSCGEILKAQEPRTAISESRRRWRSQFKYKQQSHPSLAFLFYSGPQPTG